MTQEKCEERSDGKHVKGQAVRKVYETLHREILTMKLAPSAPLDEKALADRFKLSRSPVREAMIRLAGEGLVVTLPNRSTLVAPFDITTFPSYIEALDLLQRANTRLAAEFRTDADIETLWERQQNFDNALKKHDFLLMSATNRDFHVAIATAGKNIYLTDQYRRLLNEGRRIQHLHFDLVAKSYQALLNDEHDEMIKAISDHDVERADTLAHQHTRQFRDRFFEHLKRTVLDKMPIKAA
jgi:DNA-binding GntR family transcriptional regulator